MTESVKKDNRGYLYPNKNKNKPTQPDYTGKALIDGKEWRIGAWENKTPEGNSYLSLAYTVPLPPQDTQNSNQNSLTKSETSDTKEKPVEAQKSINDDTDLDSLIDMIDPFN